MNVRQLRRFCRTFAHATERQLPDPYNILACSVGERFFAYFKTSDPERWRFSFKVTPDRFVELTGIAGVKPARYRGRYGWVTIVDVGRFPAAYLRELLEWSHRHALDKLPRRRRLALIAGAGEADDSTSSGPPR